MNSKVKKTLLVSAKLLVSGSLMYLLLSRAGIEKVFTTLKEIEPALFVLAVLLFLLTQFIASIRWGYLLPERHPLSRLYPLFLLGAFFNTFLPGLVGGDAVKIYYLYKETGKGTNALSSVFMDRYVGLFTLMLLGLLAFPFGLGYISDPRLKWALPLIVAGFLAASFIVFGLRIGRRFKVLEDVYANLRAYGGRKGDLLKAVLLSAASHTISFSCVYIIARGIDVEVPFLTLFLFVPIIATLAAVPLSISGIGIREAATVVLFGSIGIPEDKAIAISFAWFLSTVIGGLAGLYEYFTNKTQAPAK